MGGRLIAAEPLDYGASARTTWPVTAGAGLPACAATIGRIGRALRRWSSRPTEADGRLFTWIWPAATVRSTQQWTAVAARVGSPGNRWRRLRRVCYACPQLVAVRGLLGQHRQNNVPSHGPPCSGEGTARAPLTTGDRPRWSAGGALGAAHVVDRFALDQPGHPVHQRLTVDLLGVEQAVAEHDVFVAQRDVAEQVHAGGLDLGLVGVDQRQQFLHRDAEERVSERLLLAVGVIDSGEAEVRVVPAALDEQPRGAPLLSGQLTSCVLTQSIRSEYSCDMSVPLTLLGLLEREPSHGYDLKRDYDTYFGRAKPLPFGQVYATLGRLARDGKVIAAEAERGAGPDRRRYVITEQGVSDVETWLSEPVEPEPHLQTVLFAKVVLALISGRSAEDYLDRQRAAHLRRMRELTELRRSGDLVDALLADHGLFHLEADLRWIDLTSARVSALAAEIRS
jgi:DNA-binding PadR family transcriptional regulator